MATTLRWLIETLARDATAEAVSRSAVILAPHPDDEVLACGGIIAKKVQLNVPVALIFLTDGRRGIDGPADEARALREAEALGASTVLGVPPHRVYFLGIEDGRLEDHLDRAIQDVRERVGALGATDLFVPYRREFHSDHVAAWRIGAASLPAGGRLYEYPVWYGPWLWSRLAGRARVAAMFHLADAFRLVKVRVTDVVETKRNAMAAYRSQATAFANRARWGPAYWSSFLRDYELFFLRS